MNTMEVQKKWAERDARQNARLSEVQSNDLLECPFCGKDSCYREKFIITHLSMGFTTPRELDVVYCHDCGAMASWMNWNNRHSNLLADSGGEK